MKGIASKFIQQGNKSIIYHHVYYLSGHFFIYKWGYLDFFKCLTILSSVCNSPVSHTPGYYLEEPLGGGPNMLARSFEPRIIWISWGLGNHLAIKVYFIRTLKCMQPCTSTHMATHRERERERERERPIICQTKVETYMRILIRSITTKQIVSSILYNF